MKLSLLLGTILTGLTLSLGGCDKTDLHPPDTVKTGQTGHADHEPETVAPPSPVPLIDPSPTPSLPASTIYEEPKPGDPKMEPKLETPK